MTIKDALIPAVQDSLEIMIDAGYLPGWIKIRPDLSMDMVKISMFIDIQKTPFFFVSERYVNASVPLRLDLMFSTYSVSMSEAPAKLIAESFMAHLRRDIIDAMVNGGLTTDDHWLKLFENGRIYFRKDYSALVSAFPSDSIFIHPKSVETEIVWVDDDSMKGV